ncbi:hypothetical protein NKH77_17020 [Streptomyces sp. M19]
MRMGICPHGADRGVGEPTRQKTIKDHASARISTFGGTCVVSAAHYEDVLAVIGIDSHPDTDTADTGYHAMAVSMITGHGSPR